MPFGRKSLWLALGVLLLAWCLFATAALADGGNGTGPGTPGKKPLDFVSITLVGGGNVHRADNIPLTPQFELHFDKNVVNALIWARNSQCFTLVDQNNHNVPVTVTKIDDTVDFSERQNIFVQPVSPLSPDTSYILKVSPNLLAKNIFSTLGGTTSGQGLVIPFKTEAAPAASQPATPAAPQAAQGVNQVQAVAGAQNQPTGQPAAQASGRQTAGNSAPATPGGTGSTKPAGGTSQPALQTTVSTPVAGRPATSGQGAPAVHNPVSGMGLTPTGWWTIGAVVLILAWIGVEVFMRRRKRGL